MGCFVQGYLVDLGFDAIGEHTGDDHDRNIMVPFGGKPPGSEGPGRNRLPTVPFDGKTIGAIVGVYYDCLKSLRDDGFREIGWTSSFSVRLCLRLRFDWYRRGGIRTGEEISFSELS
ncbi:hypothetical protein M5K25_016218 [Dendrobium thyrsiflorum]|uniref:Uncharacterized protein n=1 Tax=Dendrobium thyrsiflorum TaxID=117978 RepID=A0ABD0UJI1_DENTH